MTQSPYGGSASQPMQSTAGPNAAQTTSSNGGRNGASGASAGSSSKSAPNDFGATTISGSPRQPGAAQQHSSVATEQRTSGSSQSSPGGGAPVGQAGNFSRPPAAAARRGFGQRARPGRISAELTGRLGASLQLTSMVRDNHGRILLGGVGKAPGALVVRLRGLQAKNEVPLRVLDENALRQYFVQNFDKDYLPNERESDQKLLGTLGLLNRGDNVVQILLELDVGLFQPLPQFTDDPSAFFCAHGIELSDGFVELFQDRRFESFVVGING